MAAAAGTAIWLSLLAAGPILTLRAGAAGAASSAPPSLGGWNVSADGNAVDILADNTSGLAGIHPLTEADFPEAQTQFESGPFGSALASVLWPGSAGGNFGSLSSELGFPAQLQPVASQLNDPVKASSQYPLGPQSATYPAGSPGGVLTMQSTAAAGGTTAEANLAGQSQSVFGFTSADGQSSSVADSTARAAATSDVSGITIAGLIRIGSVSSTASATSNGTTGRGTASTHIADVTVLGQPASIGPHGLQLPNFAAALGPVTGPIVQKVVSQTVDALGLTVTEFPATQQSSGSGYTETSGGLAVKFTPPAAVAPILEQLAAQLAPFFPAQAAIIPTLPGLLQGFNLTITLGRATASFAASPPFNDSFTPPPVPSGGTGGLGGSSTPVVGGTGSVPASTGGSAGSSVSSGPGLATPAAGGGPGSTGSSAGSPPSTATLQPATLVNLSQPLTAGLVVLGLLLATGLAGGLWRVGRMLLPTDTGPACPLGADRR